MHVVYATVQVLFTTVVARTLLRVIAIAMETGMTPWAFVAVLAQRMRTQMVSATMQMTVLDSWMLAEFAMAQVKSTRVDVPTFPKAIVIATETKQMLLAIAVVHVHQMLTMMEFVTMSMIV